MISPIGDVVSREPAGAQGRDEAAHAAAGQELRPNALRLQDLQHTDVRKASSGAGSEHERQTRVTARTSHFELL